MTTKLPVPPAVIFLKRGHDGDVRHNFGRWVLSQADAGKDGVEYICRDGIEKLVKENVCRAMRGIGRDMIDAYMDSLDEESEADVIEEEDEQ